MKRCNDVIPRSLHRFAFLTALATLGLVGIGGLVTSHGVGMAVPDWPNTYGYNMFFFPFSKWVGGIFYEHSHRLVASGVGLLTIILALWLQGHRARPLMRWGGLFLLMLGLGTGVVRPTHWSDAFVLVVTGLASLAASFVWPRCEPGPPALRWLGIIAFFAVVLQGVLGGLRVVLFKDQIGIFHATLAQLFLALICAITLFTSRWWQRRGRRTEDREQKPEGRGQRTEGGNAGNLQPILLGASVLILLQLILGATMRHQHAGLAIPDFPLAYGKLWPATDAASVVRYNQQRLEITSYNPITAGQIILQMVHRLMAVAILGAVVVGAWSARSKLGSKHVLSKGTLVWLGLILLQVLLGAATIWSNKAADIATGHVMVGALSLATGTMLCLVLRRCAGEAVEQEIRNPKSEIGFPSPPQYGCPK
jgi:cytochrome c oxidase assembly protein subunit 15